MSIADIVLNNSLTKNIDAVKNIDGGFMKDFTIRALISKDQPWWDKTTTEWRITAMHPWCRENDYNPDYWEDRVLDLLTFDLVQSNFGMNYLDLMDLDVSTFEHIEEKVHKLAERQQAAIPDEMKDRFAKDRGILKMRP